MTVSATFPCPWCGASLTAKGAGVQFACPFCRGKVTVPEMTAPVSSVRARTQTNPGVPPGSGGINALFARPSRASSPPVTEWFTSSLGKLQLAHQPHIGFLLIGPHAPHDGPIRLRAVDIYNGRIAWDTLVGEPWVDGLEPRTVRAYGANLYLAVDRSLIVRDLASGERRWAAQLTQRIEVRDGRGPGGGPQIADASPPSERGAVVVRTADHALAAFDRDSGQSLWQRRVPTGAFKQFEPVQGGGLVLRYWQGTDGKLEFIDPFRAEPVKSPGFGSDADFQRVVVEGRWAIAKVELWGDDESEGLLVLDAATGDEQFFVPVAGVTDTVRPVVAGGRVYAAIEGGQAIVSAPRGATARSPVQGSVVSAILASGPTIFVMVKSAQGTATRRLVALDPATLAKRFDCGDMGAPLAARAEEPMSTNGFVVVTARSLSGDPGRVELCGIDATSGKPVWQRPVGTWIEHYFLGEYVVVWSKERVEILNPNDGQPIAGYPFSA